MGKHKTDKVRSAFLKLVMNGTPVAKACARFNIPRSTGYGFIASHRQNEQEILQATREKFNEEESAFKTLYSRCKKVLDGLDGNTATIQDLRDLQVALNQALKIVG